MTRADVRSRKIAIAHADAEHPAFVRAVAYGKAEFLGLRLLSRKIDPHLIIGQGGGIDPQVAEETGVQDFAEAFIHFFR